MTPSFVSMNRTVEPAFTVIDAGSMAKASLNDTAISVMLVLGLCSGVAVGVGDGTPAVPQAAATRPTSEASAMIQRLRGRVTGPSEGYRLISRPKLIATTAIASPALTHGLFAR